ncbi:MULTISPECIES: major capsid protein [Eubacterium]|uniref:major capsid protein n=1 Tax=Eubacterium TaxID=1730 RepID=UPI001559A7E0|nr:MULTISPECIES: major capsid protein [Eubacterium]MBU5303172.1 hypothetical protein [Eubacterium callanderi]
MDEATITSLTSGFTKAIDDIKTPVLTILGAGVIFTVIFAGYKLLKGGFKKGTSA